MRSTRIAVALFFFVNGFIFANWVGRIPTIEDKHHLDKASLGIALFAAAVGALVTLPTTGWLIARLGGRAVTVAAGLGYCLVLPIIALAPSYTALWMSLFLAGMINGAMDVAMNAQGVLVENTYRRSIMLSFHAMFSIGGLIGAGFAALLATTPLSRHFTLVSVMMALVVVAAARYLVPAPPARHHVAFARPSRALVALGLVVFAAAVTEGAMGDWSAVYLKDSIGTSANVAALGFAGFSLGMTIGRLTGDRIAGRFGPVRVVRLGGLVTALGLGLALLITNPLVVIVGFAGVGLGVSAIFPLVYSAAGRTPGITPGAGLAAVATIGYGGFLAGPPVIGLVAHGTNLRFGLAIVALLAVMIVLNAQAVQRAGFRHEHAPSKVRGDASASPSAAD